MSDYTRDLLDSRRYGFCRVAVIIPPVYIADPISNADTHSILLKQAAEQGAMYAVCPELGLTGYTCGDLFHQSLVQKKALEALKHLCGRSTQFPNLLFTVGLPLLIDNALFNVAATILNGKVLALAPKSYLPTYREFYEGRHFARAIDAQRRTVDLPGIGENTPFGNDVLLVSKAHPHFILHTEVCEDLWMPVPPSAIAALGGATVLANLSASNITIGKDQYRQQLVTGSSARNIAVQLYAAAGPTESSTDLVFDGGGLIAERGTIIVQAKRFEREGSVTLADVDLELIIQERVRQTSFKDNAHDLNHTLRQIGFDGQLGDEHSTMYYHFHRTFDPHPFVPSNTDDLDKRCDEVFSIQTAALAQRLSALEHSTGRIPRIIIGVSGGQDSTQALLVAAHTTDQLGLPRNHIVALTMPGFGTTQGTRSNAERLIRAIGATFYERPIGEFATSMLQAVGHDCQTEDATYENTQAWARKYLELATASHEGGLVLGTGDLSELALGWTTMFGDHASHYGINAGVAKTLITHLIRWSAQKVFTEEHELQQVLLSILETPISPELCRPAADGSIAQKTEDKVGPYELNDFYLYWFVRFGLTPQKILRIALSTTFSRAYTMTELRKWLMLFLKRFFAAQYKRSCLPDGPKIGLTCLSPRGDWRMPSDASANPWLEELKEMPDTLEALLKK